ncbi:MAG: L,D-transpeptidase family protein [Parvibaculum sp.]|uniref:L,D-transpeptidase family protein n=1 Tax=Parvibaculum sp. TaxID=2024848 RepID=UPI0025DD9880|nr:L,D-transpeptidase family protein [Parvibaculum sp.]MCE9650088.1 L,D-transpeptidase family protein [Parvibaculum sp.]
MVAGILVSSAWQPARADDLVGLQTIYETRTEDTLPDIALRFDLGYVEIRIANPGIDPWLPGGGKWLSLPTQHIIPQAARRGIVINLPELRLYYFASDGQIMSFPLGIGREGKETPLGTTAVRRKRAGPTWIPTASEHAENPDLPAQVPPGPDNPMGEFALYLGWPGYAIHGTNKPYSIGRRDSHGCIRLYPQDIDTLFKNVPEGTPVTVVNEPVKAGWSDGVLYIEVHPYQADADAIETEGKPRTAATIDIDEMVISTAGDAVDRIDWGAVEKAKKDRTGMPVRIFLPAAQPR